MGVITLTSTSSQQPCWVPKHECEEATSESYQSFLVGIMCPFKTPNEGFLLRVLQSTPGLRRQPQHGFWHLQSFPIPDPILAHFPSTTLLARLPALFRFVCLTHGHPAALQHPEQPCAAPSSPRSHTFRRPAPRTACGNS